MLAAQGSSHPLQGLGPVCGLEEVAGLRRAVVHVQRWWFNAVYARRLGQPVEVFGLPLLQVPNWANIRFGRDAMLISDAYFSEPGISQRADQPRPHGALVVRLIPFEHAPAVLSPVPSVGRIERAQSQCRHERIGGLKDGIQQASITAR